MVALLTHQWGRMPGKDEVDAALTYGIHHVKQGLQELNSKRKRRKAS